MFCAPTRGRQGVEVAEDCFGKVKPELLTEPPVDKTFWQRPIPPVSYVSSLLELAGQSWLDGYTCIKDWRYSLQPLPFWIITYWRAAATAIRSRREWSKATLWLKKLSKRPVPRLTEDDGVELGDIDDMQDLLRAVGWGTRLKGAAAASHIISSDLAYLFLLFKLGSRRCYQCFRGICARESG